MTTKIIALCAFRDANEYLQGFLENVTPYVDGIIFCADRSNGEVDSWAVPASNPKVITIIERHSGNQDPYAYESRNRALLLREALAEGATSVLCLDADERLPKPTLALLREYDAAQQSMGVIVRDCWNSLDQYRVDPPWNSKTKPILFPADKVASWNMQPPIIGLHQPWVPVHHYNLAGELFHLGSLTPELRAERVRRHEAADPNHRFQANYTYLNDETGLMLESVPEGRGWK